jgi:hypothetical protein
MRYFVVLALLISASCHRNVCDDYENCAYSLYGEVPVFIDKKLGDEGPTRQMMLEHTQTFIDILRGKEMAGYRRKKPDVPKTVSIEPKKVIKDLSGVSFRSYPLEVRSAVTQEDCEALRIEAEACLLDPAQTEAECEALAKEAEACTPKPGSVVLGRLHADYYRDYMNIELFWFVRCSATSSWYHELLHAAQFYYGLAFGHKEAIWEWVKDVRADLSMQLCGIEVRYHGEDRNGFSVHVPDASYLVTVTGASDAVPGLVNLANPPSEAELLARGPAAPGSPIMLKPSDFADPDDPLTLTFPSESCGLESDPNGTRALTREELIEFLEQFLAGLQSNE